MSPPCQLNWRGCRDQVGSVFWFRGIGGLSLHWIFLGLSRKQAHLKCTFFTGKSKVLSLKVSCFQNPSMQHCGPFKRKINATVFVGKKSNVIHLEREISLLCLVFSQITGGSFLQERELIPYSWKEIFFT